MLKGVLRLALTLIHDPLPLSVLQKHCLIVYQVCVGLPLTLLARLIPNHNLTLIEGVVISVRLLRDSQTLLGVEWSMFTDQRGLLIDGMIH